MDQQPSPALRAYLDRLERFKAVARNGGFGGSPAGSGMAHELNELFARLSDEERLVALHGGPARSVNGVACRPPQPAAPPGHPGAPRPTFWGRLVRAWRALTEKEVGQ